MNTLENAAFAREPMHQMPGSGFGITSVWLLPATIDELVLGVYTVGNAPRRAYRSASPVAGPVCSIVSDVAPARTTMRW